MGFQNYEMTIYGNVIGILVKKWGIYIYMIIYEHMGF